MSKVEPNRNVYVGHRYVPKIFGEWDQSTDYEGLSIVTYQGTSYTSKKRVPVGIDILNEEYWVVTGNYNAQVEEYRQDVRRMGEYVDTEVTEIKNDFNDHKTEITNDLNDHKTEITNDLNTHKDEVNQLLGDKADKSELEMSIKQFGAKGDGVTNDNEAFTSAFEYLESNGGGHLYIPTGEYIVSTMFDVPSNTTIRGDGASTVFKYSGSQWVFRVYGERGETSNLTSNATIGSRSVSVQNASLFNVGDYIKIISQRNSFSEVDNTEDYHMGSPTNLRGANPDVLNFVEYRQINAISNNEITFNGGLIFPDYNTNANSETGWGAGGRSYVEKVNFKHDVHIKDMRFIGNYSNITRFLHARHCSVENLIWEDAYEQNLVVFENCYSCEARDSKIFYTAGYTAGADNARNGFKTISTYNCGFDNVEVHNGTQCIDFTYRSTNQFGGGPNINSYLTNSRISQPFYDGISIHPGTINSRVDGNAFTDCNGDGIFNRSKRAMIINNFVSGGVFSPRQLSHGIKISHGATQNTIVENNVIEGFDIGVATMHNADTDIKTLNLIIQGNSISRVNEGVTLKRLNSSKSMVDSNVRIMNNTFSNFVGTSGKGVHIYGYYFGIYITDNFFILNDNVNGVIFARANVARVYVDNNVITGYIGAQMVLWFEEITDEAIDRRYYSFKDNKFDDGRLPTENMRIGSLNNIQSGYQYQSLTPVRNNYMSLGSPTFRWRALYSHLDVDVVSDRELKENIKGLNLGLDFINELKPVEFSQKDTEGTKKQYGLIAQDVMEVLEKYGLNETDVSLVNKNEYYSMMYAQLIPILIKAVQELQEKQ